MPRSLGTPAPATTTAGMLVLLLLVAPPTALAGYEAGSKLEADAPVIADGRVDTLLPNGVASLIAQQPSPLVALQLDAAAVNVSYEVVYPECGIAGVPSPSCAERAGLGGDEGGEVTLTDARVKVVRAVTAYKIITTTDRGYLGSDTWGASGKLVATTGASTILGTNTQSLYASPYAATWSADETRQPSGPVYQLERLGGQFSATGALVRGTGGFQVLLQGFEVEVAGTLPDGAPFERTYATPYPGGDDDPYRFLVLETDGGDLEATSAGAYLGYAPRDQRPVVDVPSRVSFRAAEGEVVKDGDATGYEGDDVVLRGPLSLTLVATTAGDPARVGFEIADGLRLQNVVPPPRDERNDANELMTAGAAGAGGAGLLIALAYFWPRLKYAGTAAFLPLYSRIERRSVLDHEKREELYELIRNAPGIHAHEIGERAGIGWGTTVYHLKLLEQHQLVVSKKAGRYKRFFVNTGEYTKKKDVYGALRNDTARAVADHILNHAGTSQKEMCQALGIQPSLASWHVEKLEGVQLVKRVKDGRQVRYYAGPAWSQLNVRLTPEGVEEASAVTGEDAAAT